MELRWTAQYPHPALLREEVQAMADAFVEVLLRRLAASTIAGIYLKGAAAKHWDSPVDYVPELSDVDIHLLFRDPSAAALHFGSVSTALEIRAEIERAYRQRVTRPVHLPEPQFIVLNRIRQMPDYCPAPKAVVRTLYGEDLQEEMPAASAIRELDRAKLLSFAARLEALPLRVIDKPAAQLRDVLRDLNWQVSPTGPRVLTLLGVPPGQAWALNRTRVVSLLKDLGEPGLASDYHGFYLAGWDYFLSGYRDHGAAERGVLAFAGAMGRAIEVAANADRA